MNKPSIKVLLFALLVEGAISPAAGQGSNQDRYFDRSEEGWFWYAPETEPAPEVTTKDEDQEPAPISQDVGTAGPEENSIRGTETVQRRLVPRQSRRLSGPGARRSLAG